MSMFTDYDQHLLDNVQRIHFVGCGGSGMFPLIQILAARGYTITGSDVLEGSILETERKMGVAVHMGHCADNVIGADLVVFPEYEMGMKLAQSLSSTNILNFIELSEDYGIVELAAPKAWQGRTLRELNVRAKYKVNVIALRRNGDEHDLQMSPSADDVIGPGDVVVTLGRYEDIDRLHQL